MECSEEAFDRPDCESDNITGKESANSVSIMVSFGVELWILLASSRPRDDRGCFPALRLAGAESTNNEAPERHRIPRDTGLNEK
jgi:hypothetical protein